jgi:hypothetical protein
MIRWNPVLAYFRYNTELRGPIGVLITSIAIALVGLAMFLANLNTTGQIHKIAGTIEQDYIHSHEDYSGAGYVYDQTWLQISGNEGFFIFNKNDFHPVWDDHVFIGQKIDIYYGDETPKKVFAIQLYDENGNPSTRFTTIAFDKNPNTYQEPGIGPQPGLVILAIGLLLTMIGIVLVVRLVHHNIAYDRESIMDDIKS